MTHKLIKIKKPDTVEQWRFGSFLITRFKFPATSKIIGHECRDRVEVAWTEDNGIHWNLAHISEDRDVSLQDAKQWCIDREAEIEKEKKKAKVRPKSTARPLSK